MYLENLPWKEIEAMQIKKLNELKKYLLERSKFYQQKWKNIETTQNVISSLDDLNKYPTTSKEDIQLFGRDLICTSTQNILEYCATSGTLGNPIAIPLTKRDLERLAYNEALSFEKLKVTNSDTVLLMLTLDRMFMAGMAYYSGLHKIGATVVRSGAGIPQMQWDAIFKYEPSVIVGVPSFILKMLQYAEANNIDYKNSSVKKILAIGESLKDENLHPNTLYNSIKEKWNIAIHNTYASTEMQTGFTECEAQCGGHLHADILVVEIVDENGQSLPPDTIGEVCITTLDVEGLPLWRYKTGDIAKLYTATCSCGRSTPRMSGIIGRKNQMLKLNGTSVFPSTIFDALHQKIDANDYYIEVTKNEIQQDKIVIYINKDYEQNDTNFSALKEFMKAKLRIQPQIKPITIDALKKLQFPELSRKQIKFADKRI